MEPTTLSKLPGSILAEIFSGEHSSYLIVILWQCGDSLLNRKFAQDITYLDLKDTITDTDTCFPSVVFCLKNLRSLSIDRRQYNFKGSSASSLLQLESSKLTSLKIGSQNITDLFINDCARPGQVSPSSLDLSIKFATLRSLTITRCPHNNIQHLPPNLPPSLTYLEAPGLDITLDSGSVFTSLPKCLHTWNGPFTIHPSIGGTMILDPSVIGSKLIEIFRDLPPSLTHIGSIKLISMSKTLRFEFLPKTLNVSSGLFHFDCLTMDVLRSLPPATRKMAIIGVSDEWKAHQPPTSEWAALLPSDLEHLELRLDPGVMIADLVKNLPRKLRILSHEISSIAPEAVNWEEITNPEFWPPGLTQLVLRSGVLSNEAKKMLPATLTHLECSQYDRQLYIPPNLKRLICALVFPQLEFYSPSILKKLSQAQTEQVDLSSIKLPGDSLQYLDLKFWQLPFDLDKDILPRNLTTLSLTQFSMKWFEKLPRTLTNFSCNRLLHLPDIAENSASVDYFGTLPPHLKYLELGSHLTTSMVFPANSFASLTRLTHLRCIDMGRFDSEVLEHLQAVRIVSMRLTQRTEKTEAYKKLHPVWTLQYK